MLCWEGGNEHERIQDQRVGYHVLTEIVQSQPARSGQNPPNGKPSLGLTNDSVVLGNDLSII